MNITLVLYFVLLSSAIAGILIIRSGSGIYRILRAKRWRLQVKPPCLKDYPIISLISISMNKSKKQKMDMEIYEAISFLRNITAIGKGNSASADTIIEQLAQHRGLLSPVYNKMLRYLRQNQKEAAIQYFSDAVGTEISKDFARLLIQWDEIDPGQLMETLLSHQKNIKEVRITIQKRRDEIVSDIIYLPVVTNVMLVFINFIYVGYFIDQKEMLTVLL